VLASLDLEHKVVYIKPSPTAQGQTTYDPNDKLILWEVHIQDNLSTVVQAIKDGRMGYTKRSRLTQWSKSNSKMLMFFKALGPGFDTVLQTAQATAKGSNVQTIGTAKRPIQLSRFDPTAK